MKGFEGETEFGFSSGMDIPFSGSKVRIVVVNVLKDGVNRELDARSPVLMNDIV